MYLEVKGYKPAGLCEITIPHLSVRYLFSKTPSLSLALLDAHPSNG